MPFASSLPSPMALSKHPQTPSIFKKRSAKPSIHVDAASYLTALSQADAFARARSHSSSSSTSTPALSISSSTTSFSESTIVTDSAELTNDGLSLPLNPPTSGQVFTTLHTEFGHCANPDFRTTSMHPPGTSLPAHVEQDPPYYVVISAYMSYIIVLILGHLRDFMGKHFNPASYQHLIPRDVSVSDIPSHIHSPSINLVLHRRDVVSRLCSQHYCCTLFLASGCVRNSFSRSTFSICLSPCGYPSSLLPTLAPWCFFHASGFPSALLPTSYFITLASFRFPPAFVFRSLGPTAQVSRSLQLFSSVVCLPFRVGIAALGAAASRINLACSADHQSGLSSSPGTGSIFGENLSIFGSFLAYSLAIFIRRLLSHPCTARRGMHLGILSIAAIFNIKPGLFSS